MRTISATEAKVRFAALLDDAKREPVLIRSHNRDVAIIMSPVDYARLAGTNLAEKASWDVKIDQMMEASRAKSISKED